MTILETNIYQTLLDIEEEKARQHIEPRISLLIKDNLLERVEMRMGCSITFGEFIQALQSLEYGCKIHLGDTPTDQYAKVIYHEFPSTL